MYFIVIFEQGNKAQIPKLFDWNQNFYDSSMSGCISCDVTAN